MNICLQQKTLDNETPIKILTRRTSLDCFINAYIEIERENCVGTSTGVKSLQRVNVCCEKW